MSYSPSSPVPFLPETRSPAPGPPASLASVMASCNHSTSIYVFSSFFSTTASLSLQGYEDGTLFADIWPRGKTSFLSIEQSHGRTMVGQSWLVCLLMPGLIVLLRGVDTNGSKAFLPSCGWQPFQNHREIGTKAGQKRNNWCSLCDYYSSILCMKKLRPKRLNKFPSPNLSNVN